MNENVIGGSRLFGQFKNNSFGMLNIHTNNNDNNLSTSYSAFRLRKDIRSRSTFGAIFTNVSNSEINNSVFGIDAQARFWEIVPFHYGIATYKILNIIISLKRP